MIERPEADRPDEPSPDRPDAPATDQSLDVLATEQSLDALATDQSLDVLATERRLPEARELDQLPVREQVALLARQDAVAVAAVADAGDRIAEAVELAAARLRGGGRLIEIGAGTPGRLALLDAAECGPTFGVEEGRVVGIMAGGPDAARRPREHVEDDVELGRDDLDAIGVGPADVVVGLSASGRTPYVVAALSHAREQGAATVAVVSNPDSPLAACADVAIETLTGPEVLSGSTRLKAGTAQKLVLNALSTLTMVALGHTYGDLMVDVRATNDKLRRRAHRVVVTATGADRGAVTHALAAADGNAKTAIVMLLADLPAPVAARRLADAGGRVHDALAAAVQDRS